ncbi:MAG: hypothetical protein ABUT20_12835 [Bacteroidota bacterium]
MTGHLTKIVLVIVLFLQYSCKKNNSPAKEPDPHFIQAKFNGITRKITENEQYSNARFFPSLNHANNTWGIALVSDNGQKDTVCRGIWITFTYVPALGKHYFNNSPLSYLPDPGLIANYLHYDIASDLQETRYSMDGYVVVTELTRDDIRGTFTFNAKSDSGTDTTVIAVTEGSFYLHNYGGSDYWAGP